MLFCLLVLPNGAWASNKRIMTINAAKVVAERALMETVYGLKVRGNESVENMIATSYMGTAESKTEAQIVGVVFEEDVFVGGSPDTAHASQSKLYSEPGSVMGM